MASTGPSAAASVVPLTAPSGAAPPPVSYDAAPLRWRSPATPATGPLARLRRRRPTMGPRHRRRSSASPSPLAPPLPVDPLLLCGAFDAPVPTYGNPTYGAPPVYGSPPVYWYPGYRWGSSVGQHSQQPDGARYLQHLPADQQVFPAGHPAYPAPQSQPGLLPIPYGEYPPPQPSGGYGLPMASPSPSPALPPAPWDPVLLPALHAAPTPNNYTGGGD
nr:vegetative cell wall protein gp1-like [Aegilops tauschii subsp. strangulata]